ncbi:o-succinylbenzoate synthase [Pseudalkalibacillus caeni]|uniref:o-succinylbenzoate synthase n=1 Tax=Exobacillus caeni TaxID=2574798 RepID=A0A5R9F456_9BACL|nr:o-succinylbenzoate synthase [Pseudalkalibacillus caeni]TLS38367.1 o-succinylbenzoate synthase [Pseudalkalibacillus caeni]
MLIPIEKVILHKVRMKMKTPFKNSFGSVQEKEFFIVELADGREHRGFGESVAFSSPWYTEETVGTTEHIMNDFLVPFLLQNPVSHPREVTKLFDVIRRNNMAKAAIEGAVWDLYAKREGITLAKALGGEKNTVEAGISIGIQPSIKELLTVIGQYAAKGYKRVKIKIKPGWDIEVIKQVREAYPELPIMADANSAYTLADIEHLKKLDEFGLMMIEQPLGQEDLLNHAKLQKEIETPVCLDESIHSLDDVKNAIALGSCKVINIKIGRVGGLEEAKKIHDYCMEHNIPVWCGGMLEAGVGRAHNIAVSTLQNFVLPGDTAGSSRYWEKDIIEPEVTVIDGIINVPDSPGIGYNINRAALEKFTMNKKEFTLENIHPIQF